MTATKMMIVASPIRVEISHSSRWSRTFIAGSEQALRCRRTDSPRSAARDQAGMPAVRSGLGRIEAGLLVDRLNDVGADARLHLLVHLDEGALPHCPLV